MRLLGASKSALFIFSRQCLNAWNLSWVISHHKDSVSEKILEQIYF